MSEFLAVPKYIDGYYGSPQRISRTPRRYPFAGNGDITTAEYDATYLVDQGAFTPTARGTLDSEARSVAISSANTGTDVITCAAAHSFVTGQCVHLTVTSGLTGLTTAKAYFAIVASSTTLKLATNSENAFDGTAIDITADGTGTLYEGFYLIDETKPEIFNGDVAEIRRTYSNIPQQQIVPGSKFVTKPDLPGEFPQVSGNSLIIQPEENVPRWVFYTNKAVTSDSGAPNASSPTGGTYTVTIGASTTGGIAYNASASTLQTALNALASVSARGTVTVTGTYQAGFTIQFNAYSAATVNTASLTGGGGYSAAAVSSSVVNVVEFSIRSNALPGSASFTGGTFTITIFGQTTAAIAYNATAADVKSAVEALSNVGSGNATVINPGSGNGYSGTNILNTLATQIGFYVKILPPSVTATGSSLTPTGSAANTVSGTALYSTRLTFTGIALATRELYSAGHGISATDGIVVTQGENFRTIPAGYYSVTTDTVILTSASGVAFTTPTLITYVGAATGSVYTAGSKLTRVKRVTDFYLPGKSVGIDTIDDIPLPDYEGDDASLLQAIFEGDTDINYEVGELEYHRDGPMTGRTRTTLDASQL